MDSTAFYVIAILAILAQSFLIFLALFEPTLKYKVTEPPAVPLDSPEFLRILEALADSHVHTGTAVEVLTNGEVYYEQELDALRRARHHIHLEAYIFAKGKVTEQFLEVLTERAKAGVQVRLVLDAIGSFRTTKSYCQSLLDAGGRVCWYHPFRWSTIARINNRTHREMIIVDGELGFIGGAGFADHWRYEHKGLFQRKPKLRWRDSMFRVEGEAVTGMQSAFLENWLEASGEVFAQEEYFPFCQADSETAAMIVDSPPTAGRATRARMLFQVLIASAKQQLLITTPYFLPDESARKILIQAIKERGVDVRIVVPGTQSDHLLTRRSSRRLYGDLLRAGARIFEYQPTMNHTKSLVVDGTWSVVGSTNFDHRSFGLNDEVNLAVRDVSVAQRLAADFAADQAESHEVLYEEWNKRPITERVHEWMGWLLERQQ